MRSVCHSDCNKDTISNDAINFKRWRNMSIFLISIERVYTLLKRVSDLAKYTERVPHVWSRRHCSSIFNYFINWFRFLVLRKLFFICSLLAKYFYLLGAPQTFFSKCSLLVDDKKSKCPRSQKIMPARLLANARQDHLLPLK